MAKVFEVCSYIERFEEEINKVEHTDLDILEQCIENMPTDNINALISPKFSIDIPPLSALVALDWEVRINNYEINHAKLESLVEKMCKNPAVNINKKSIATIFASSSLNMVKILAKYNADFNYRIHKGVLIIDYCISEKVGDYEDIIEYISCHTNFSEKVTNY